MILEQLALSRTASQPVGDTEREEGHTLVDGAPEDPLAMARRHVAEGRKRVARQETLVSTIITSSYGEVLAQAQELLVTLQTSLVLMEWDLERLEKKHRDDGD